MVEKTQILIQHIKSHHLELALTANISENTAIIRMYMIIIVTVKLSIASHHNFEPFRLRKPIVETVYIEVNGIIHTFMPDDIDDMPPLEDITDDEIIDIFPLYN